MMRFKLSAMALALGLTLAAEPFTVNYSASMEGNAASGSFAPYYIGALRGGKITSGSGGNLDLAVWKPLDLSKRFSYAFAVEGVGRLGNKIAYDRYFIDTQEWKSIPRSTSNVWLQQLYGQVKYRGVFLTVGLHDFHSALLNKRLSSGDLIESGNTRSIPGFRAGFVDFQNIPFTKGWLQIQGEIGWYKSTDNGWQKSHFDYYNYHLNLGWWYNYKRMYFRTKPSERFCVTFGMQASGQFAGYTYYYVQGREQAQVEGHPLKVMDFIDMLVPAIGDAYVRGNHLGTWDIHARYRLNNGDNLMAYTQWPWEDGSGIGKLNGWDGLWGVEWQRKERGPVRGAVLEFMTYMNQSGPIHHDFDDNSSDLLISATGADNYYNNTWFNGYALYGMCIGSPMFPQPVRNVDGATTRFLENRFWGLHGAVEGDILPTLSYRVMVNYRRYFGTMFVPRVPTHSVSGFVEAKWTPAQVPGLAVKAQLAFDAGNSIYGRNFGGLLSASYSGIFNFKNGKSTPCVF